MSRSSLFAFVALVSACTTVEDLLDDPPRDTGNPADTGANPVDPTDTDDTGVDSGTDSGTDSGDTGTDPRPADPVDVTCANPPPAVSTGDACGHTPGTGAAVLLHVGTVLGSSETYLGGAQVLLDAGGAIACVGCDCASDPLAGGAAVIACPDGVASPGLINAHDHVSFSANAPFPPTATRYDHRHDWRAVLSTPGNDNSNGHRWVEVRQAMAGTTTVLGSTVSNGMLRNPDRNGGDEGLDLGTVNETFPLGDGGRQFREDCGWNYELTTEGIGAVSWFAGHVAEGIDEYAHEEVRCLTTPMDGGQDLTTDNASHVHGVGLFAIDHAELVRDGTSLVWSPRTNISLYGFTAQVRLHDALGGRIALGTDWTYTGSATILRELSCAASFNETYLDGWFSDIDLWRMVTSEAARAVGAAGRLGELSRGREGDIAVFDGRTRSAHAAVIEAEQSDVWLVLRGGEPLFGDRAVVQALDATCDPVDVCGATRAVCTQREFGQSFTALASANTSSYPAIFCDVPSDEPTCVPSRPGAFTGAVTADDPDGDGIVTAQDNCPTVFNAIRPIDRGSQPDADRDGTGDACDPTPLVDDVDGDGVLNSVDICWRDPDPQQSDRDTDGLGDACDPCVDIPSPDGACPPPAVDIPTARASPRGTGVRVVGIVTAVIDGQRIIVQDPTVASGVQAGVFVFAPGGTPPLGAGDRVEVQGEIDQYFNNTEIEGATVTRLGPPAGRVDPVAVTVAQAVTEAYEGTLVTITDATVSDPAHVCSADQASCRDADLWEIGGPTGVVVDRRAFDGADAAWAAGVADGAITGVLTYRFDRRRLLPRDRFDLP